MKPLRKEKDPARPQLPRTPGAPPIHKGGIGVPPKGNLPPRPGPKPGQK